ncbi:MAG: twin-arginine translocation signal domain-containing protein, partial [Desulfobacterales bacterium]
MNSNGIIDLRKRLSKNLKRLIGNTVIEEKELAAFDLIMSRRQFLKAAQFTAIGALVASAYPPTAWGRYDRDLHVSPKDVGLTLSDQKTATIATQLVSGTELFQETVYA